MLICWHQPALQQTTQLDCVNISLLIMPLWVLIKTWTRQLISIFLSCTIYILRIDKSKSSMRRTSIKILVIQLEMKTGLWLSFMIQKFDHMNCGVENWFETSVQYIIFQIKFLFSTRFEKWRVQPQWILLRVISKGELS